MKTTVDLDDPFDIPSTDNEEASEFDSNFDDGFGDDSDDNQSLDDSDDHFPDDSNVNDFADDGYPDENQQTPANNRGKSSDENQVQQPKPLLKTPFGMAICGIAVIGVTAIGITAYKVSNPPVTESVEEAYVEISPAQVPYEPAGEVDFGANQNHRFVSAEAGEAINPVVDNTASQVLNLPDVIPKMIELPGVVMQPIQVQAIVPDVVASNQEIELKKLLGEQQELTEELKKTNVSLSQALRKLSRVVEQSREDQIVLSEQVAAIKESLKPAIKPVADEALSNDVKEGKAETAAAVVVKSLTEGRSRVPGLQVVDTTENGKMTIIKKASNGRVFTMFKGESITTAKGHFKITSVLENGSLLLVGDNYFIDNVVEPMPVPVAKVKAKKPPVTHDQRPKPTISKAKQAASLAQCNKFTLNAVYDAGKSFGVVSPSGDFISYKIGDKIPGVGAIKGLDDSGSLAVGNCVIRSVY